VDKKQIHSLFKGNTRFMSILPCTCAENVGKKMHHAKHTRTQWYHFTSTPCSEIPITNATSSREWHPLDDLIKKGHKQMLVGFRLVNSSCLDQASNKRKLAYSTAEFPLCL
jgi:hypothetical protein